MRTFFVISLVVASATGVLGVFIPFWNAGFPETRDTAAAQNPSIVEVADVSPPLTQQCRERSRRVQQQLGREYSVSIHVPFVLAGDPAVELQHQYGAVIQPTCEILERRFFDRSPDRPLKLLLHSNEAAYRANAERLYFDRRVSRFGYFKPGRYVVLVNLAEGPGALRHELVHALMHFDFPHAPPWLREGLATLYESGEYSSDSVGPCWRPTHNWRLKVLKRQLDTTAAPDLRQLLHAVDFRGLDEAVAYAQARYLCMYLHQTGYLQAVYRGVRAGAGDDPSGEHALLAALPHRSLAELEGQFHHWVLSLCQ
jgi:hypothetical protein